MLVRQKKKNSVVAAKGIVILRNPHKETVLSLGRLRLDWRKRISFEYNQSQILSRKLNTEKEIAFHWKTMVNVLGSLVRIERRFLLHFRVTN